jgi:hypothetical protein
MDRSDAERVIRALEGFATAGLGDVKALKGALKGRYRPVSLGNRKVVSERFTFLWYDFSWALSISHVSISL